MEKRSQAYLVPEGYPPGSSPQKAQLEYGYDQPQRGCEPSTSGCGPSALGNGQPPPGYGQPPPGYGQPPPGYGQQQQPETFVSPQKAQLEYGYDQPQRGCEPSTSGCGPSALGNGQPPPGYGQQQQPETFVITQPSRGTIIIQPVVRPPDYLILSIVSFLFCWPLAICAIMSAVSSRNSSDASDFDSARREGQTARNIANGAILCGIIILIVSSIVLHTTK